MKNSNFLSSVQIWAYTEHPPPWKWKTLTFFSEFRTELTQNTPPPTPRKWKTLTSFPEFRSELTQNTPPRGGWSMWKLYPPRIPSRSTSCGLWQFAHLAKAWFNQVKASKSPMFSLDVCLCSLGPVEVDDRNQMTAIRTGRVQQLH